MFTTIQKWGNSKAVRLPKGILEEVSLDENDTVEILTEKDYIIIKPAKKRHKRLEERIAEYSGEYKCTELDSGEAKGKEVW